MVGGKGVLVARDTWLGVETRVRGVKEGGASTGDACWYQKWVRVGQNGVLVGRNGVLVLTMVMVGGKAVLVARDTWLGWETCDWGSAIGKINLKKHEEI